MLRGIVVALLSALAAACAQLPDKVGVGIGTAGYEQYDAAPYAALYLPYARMAALAYADPQFLGTRRSAYCPNAAELGSPAKVDDRHPAEENQQRQAWLRALKHGGWRCVSGAIGPIDCPRGVRCVEGLQYQVWRKECSEAVISFRGSDAGDAGDWLSNFRWFLGHSVFDEYDQVQSAIRGIVNALYTSDCKPGHIIATGHSLGGGLAQHVAYADSRIDYVYAFDSSPVTAFFAVPLRDRIKADTKLGIDRIYEAGEILSLPRYLVSGVFPTSQCRPRVRIVRFNTGVPPSLLERHKIADLTVGFERLLRGRHVRPLPPAYDDARNCTFAPADERGS